MKKVAIGTKVVIPAGTKVMVDGITMKRNRDTQVTARNVEYTKGGNPKVYWKSNGKQASAILK